MDLQLCPKTSTVSGNSRESLNQIAFLFMIGVTTDPDQSILTGSSSSTSHTYTVQAVDENGSNQTSGGDHVTLEVGAVGSVVGLPMSILMTDQGNG